MKDKFFFDLGRIMDEFFNAAHDFGNAFKDSFEGKGPYCQFVWDENVDYYPAYAYPPANIYMTSDKHLVFEFAMAGFTRDQIKILFQGDYMILTAKPDQMDEEKYKDVKFFKKRLKLREIIEQKYYAPSNKFDRDKISAVFKNGLLRIDLSPKVVVETEEEIKVDIVDDEEVK